LWGILVFREAVSSQHFVELDAEQLSFESDGFVAGCFESPLLESRGVCANNLTGFELVLIRNLHEDCLGSIFAANIHCGGFTEFGFVRQDKLRALPSGDL
jgi:hypothetical protein